MPDPLHGVLFHWIGGFASASFYIPYKGVRRWRRQRRLGAWLI